MYEEQLAAAVRTLQECGCLPRVLELVAEVWTDNLARYDPQKGDDTRTLGFTTAANISNRLMKDEVLRRCEVAEVASVEGWAMLQIAGYDVKVYKLRGLDTTVSPHTADWSGSETKARGARENSNAVVQLELFDEDALASSSVPLLHHLHLVHTADQETGQMVAYIGFPRTDDHGDGPWYAVVKVTEAEDAVTSASQGSQPQTSYSEQPRPDLGIALKQRSDDAVASGE